MIINTSFNIRGEPIVCSPAEAFGRQAVSKTFDRDIRSCWVDVEKADDVKDYYRQF